MTSSTIVIDRLQVGQFFFFASRAFTVDATAVISVTWMRLSTGTLGTFIEFCEGFEAVPEKLGVASSSSFGGFWVGFGVFGAALPVILKDDAQTSPSIEFEHCGFP